MGQIKAPIAGNSKAIDKSGNAELAHFNKQMLIHELIRGSLEIKVLQYGPFFLIWQRNSKILTHDNVFS
jgi:hypothetical protein